MPCRPKPLLLILLTVVAFHALGIYLYTTGFFLTRYQVNNFSTCNRGHPSSSCYDQLPAKFRKAVIIVIDALQFNFTILHTQEQSSAPINATYLNKLPIIFRTLQEKPRHSFLFKFIADPPTTTMQRIKGLTTGGLPTFMDASDNFASDAITEDNWVYQAQRMGKNVVFMGDDTWVSLFPGHFARAYPFPSFNVKDLHTVDNGVIQHLIPEITTRKDWDIIIAHFLGVDHVGHRYGMDHPEMALKLTQMNTVLQEVIDAIDEDTILFVMGDHGMTVDGNHGGASDHEIESALFIYSKTALSNMDSRKYTSAHTFPAISQVDFVPTLCLLLGMPIPYGNLGLVIPELFSGDDNNSNTIEQSLHRLVNAMEINLKALNAYLNEYSTTTRQFPDNIMSALQLEYRSALSTSDLNERVHRMKKYHDKAMQMCRALWTTFNEASMLGGIVFVGVSLVVLLAYLAPRFKSSLWSTTTHPIVIFSIVAAVMRSASLWSNSYIEAERLTVYYLLLTVLIPILLTFARLTDSSIACLRSASLLLLLLRIAATITFGGYHDNYFASVESTYQSGASTIFIYVLALCAVYAPAFLVLILSTLYKGKSILDTIGSILLSITTGLLIVYRIAQQADLLDTSWTIRVLLPNICHAGSILSFVISRRLISLFPSLSFIGGPSSSTAFAILFVIHKLFINNVLPRLQHQKGLTLSTSLIYCLLASLFFYTTNHQPQFSSLHFSAPFTGYDEFDQLRGAVIIVINTLSSFFIVTYLVFTSFQGRAHFEDVPAAYLLWFTIFTLNTMGFTFLQRRHLMVWRIFAPKYIFDGATLLAVDAVLLLMCILYVAHQRKM